MKWWKHFLIWAALLAVPSWMVANAYHMGLRAAASAILGLPLPSGEIEVDATQVLGIYAAMCLASLRAPPGRRMGAILLGIPLLFALELLTGVVAIRSELYLETGGRLPAVLLRFRDVALTAPPWLAAPVLWLAFLGRWELGLPGSSGRRGGRLEKPDRPHGARVPERSASAPRR
jgi:hypothetical protein